MREVTVYKHFFQVISMDKIKKLIKANDGFTLVELILSFALLSIFLTMITPMIIQPFMVEKSSQRMSARQMTELNLRKIARYARNANNIVINSNIYKIIGDEVEISYNSSDDNIKKDGKILIRNAEMEIKENSEDIYKIIITKNNEEDPIKVSTIIQIRN